MENKHGAGFGKQAQLGRRLATAADDHDLAALDPVEGRKRSKVCDGHSPSTSPGRRAGSGKFLHGIWRMPSRNHDEARSKLRQGHGKSFQTGRRHYRRPLPAGEAKASQFQRPAPSRRGRPHGAHAGEGPQGRPVWSPLSEFRSAQKTPAPSSAALARWRNISNSSRPMP